MKNFHTRLVFGWLIVTALASSLAMAQQAPASDTACQTFESKHAEYQRSLGKDETGKPMASEQSVQLAWGLIGSAENCLAERDVAFERISTYALKIESAPDAEPGATALQLDELTNGAVIYDVGFFLRKPYAAGGFEDNILYLPHKAVLGELDMVTRHEMNHARAHSLILDDDLRLRHLWIFAADSMFVDEVLAYADGGINKENIEQMRTWSLDMAHQYIAATRKLIEAPGSEIAMTMDGPRCAMTPVLQQEISGMLNCIEGVLESDTAVPADVAVCDGPRTQATICTP